MPKQISVVNLRTYRLQDYFYIGRPGKGQTSILGNPFKMDKYSRKEAISMYRRWLWEQHIKPWLETGIESDIVVELIAIAEMNKEYEVKLGCFCHPQPCHGEVIISAVRFMQQPWVFITGQGSTSEELEKQINYAMKNSCVLFLDGVNGGEVIQKINAFLTSVKYPYFFLCTNGKIEGKSLKVSHNIESLCKYKLFISKDEVFINSIS